MKNKVIITIARQFGSGGHNIGQKLSKVLSIKFYDKELINIASKNSGINKSLFDDYDEKSSGSLLYSLSLGLSTYNNSINSSVNMPVGDKLFLIQRKIILEIAEKESAVIVGRCADDILQDKFNVLKVFVYASTESRINRISEKYELPYDKAETLVKKTDKKRAAYHNIHSDFKWENAENYDICLNSDIGIENAVDILKLCAKHKFNFSF